MLSPTALQGSKEMNEHIIYEERGGSGPGAPPGFRCTLCVTGYMFKKSMKAHVRGSNHLAKLSKARMKEELVTRRKCAALYAMKADLLPHPRWRAHIKAKLFDYMCGNITDLAAMMTLEFKKFNKMEKSSLLELAVWKASCLHFDGSLNFHTMQDILDQWALDQTFNPATYKAERRYTSNVAVIMQSVVSFLWNV